MVEGVKLIRRAEAGGTIRHGGPVCRWESLGWDDGMGSWDGKLGWVLGMG
jgi:hypothetical protein